MDGRHCRLAMSDQGDGRGIADQEAEGDFRAFSDSGTRGA